MNDCMPMCEAPKEPELFRFIKRLEEEVKEGYEVKYQLESLVSNLKPMIKDGSEKMPTAIGEGFCGQAFALLYELEKLNGELRVIKNHLRDIVG